VAAWRAGTLTGAGGWAAGLVGTMVLTGAGWAGGAVLAAFFLSSNLLSRLAPAVEGIDAKGDRRDTRQVLANGGVAALGALAGLSDPRLGLWLVTGSLAAAAADTWATAAGGLSSAPPRLLWSRRIVPRGSSGGMTTAGNLGAGGGALVVSVTGAIGAADPALIPAGMVIGFVGMIADSALGATLQGRFHCPACGVPSEWPVHRCGTTTARQGGLPWLDNDGVNLAATSLGALLALGAWAWHGRSS